MNKQADFLRSLAAVILILVSFPMLLLGSEEFGMTVAGIGLFFVGIMLPLYKAGLFR